jgi:hypothetical protein
VPEKRQHIAKLAICRLFPRLQNIGYSSSFVEKWEAERLVCSNKHFDTYFRMGIGSDNVSATEVNDLIQKSGNEQYVKDTFHKAHGSIRKNGKSKVPLLLDELNVRADAIEKENVVTFLSAMFSDRR